MGVGSLPVCALLAGGAVDLCFLVGAPAAPSSPPAGSTCALCCHWGLMPSRPTASGGQAPGPVCWQGVRRQPAPARGPLPVGVCANCLLPCGALLWPSNTNAAAAELCSPGPVHHTAPTLPVVEYVWLPEVSSWEEQEPWEASMGHRALRRQLRALPGASAWFSGLWCVQAQRPLCLPVGAAGDQGKQGGLGCWWGHRSRRGTSSSGGGVGGCAARGGADHVSLGVCLPGGPDVQSIALGHEGTEGQWLWLRGGRPHPG